MIGCIVCLCCWYRKDLRPLNICVTSVKIIYSGQNFITLSSYLNSFCNHNGHQLYTRMKEKDVPRHLAPVVVEYYFIQDLHVSLKLKVAKSPQSAWLNREILTLIALLLCKIFAILLYHTITVQNIHKQTNNNT